MNKHWNNIKAVLGRTVLPHDTKHYLAIEKLLYDELMADKASGMASEATKTESGRKLQEALEGMLEHPLCKTLSAKPELYFHYECAGPMNFKNFIVLPSIHAERVAFEPDFLKIAKANIAHELGHLICRDYDPAQHSYNPQQNMNQRMERRADLIAAHLCGDGGAALAESYKLLRSHEKMIRRGISQGRWADRLVNRITGHLDRRYPTLETRIAYLEKWAEEFRQGTPLPQVEMPAFSPQVQSTLRRQPAEFGR